MNTLKSAILGIALATAAGQASAGALQLTDWGFNPNGTGVGGVITPIDEITYSGISFTESTGTTPGSTFQDVGHWDATAFRNDLANVFGTGLNSSYEITATFLDWTGTYGATTAGNTAFTFNPGGTLSIFIDHTPDQNGTFLNDSNGTNIMTLSILSGGGNINFGGVSGADGNVDILFQITSVETGYWFLDMNNDGLAETDISDLLLASALTIGLTDSNNNIFAANPGQVADFVNTTGLGNGTGPGDIYTTNDGSATIGTVPEPGTIALLGLGLIGFSAVSRRRA